MLQFCCDAQSLPLSSGNEAITSFEQSIKSALRHSPDASKRTASAPDNNTPDKDGDSPRKTSLFPALKTQSRESMCDKVSLRSSVIGAVPRDAVRRILASDGRLEHTHIAFVRKVPPTTLP